MKTIRPIIILGFSLFSFWSVTQSQVTGGQQPNVAMTAADDGGSPGFDAYFMDKTMRLDYYHSGNA
ncbi:MAG: hypothetical protein WCL00_02935, partial [Bacteroidota bacterium]